MPQYAQFENENPIIRDQPIASKAEGYETLAKVAGVAQDELVKQAAAMGEEESSANLMSAHSNLQDIDKKTRLQIEADPANANKYLDQSKQLTQTVLDSSYVNKKDRNSLKYLSDTAKTDLDYYGNQKAVESQKNLVKYTQMNEFNNNVQTIFDKMFTDPKAADTIIDGLKKSIEANVRAGIYTPVEGATQSKLIAAEIKRANARGAHYQQGTADAATANAINSYQPSPTAFSNANMPMDQQTMHGADLHLENLSTQDIKAKIANNGSITPWDLRNIKSNNEYNHYYAYNQGAAIAEGMVKSGAHYSALVARQKELNQPKQTLTSQQEGQRDRLNNLLIGLEQNGGFGEMVDSTPAGAKAIIDYQHQQAAIQKTVFTGTPEEKAIAQSKAYKENINDLIHKREAVGIGMEVPDRLRSGVPKQISEPVKSMFTKNGDVNLGLENLQLLNKNNIVSLAKLMPNALQYQTAYEAGMLQGQADNDFIIPFVQSQQDGLQFKELNLQDRDSKLSDDKIRTRLLKNTNFTQLLNNYNNRSNSAEMKSAKAQQAIKYIQYMAANNNDYTGSNIDDYISKFSDNLVRAYPQMSSFSYHFDTNIVGVKSEDDASSLAHYALQKTYTKLREYMNEYELNDYISKNKPFVINTPSGRVTVVDKTNQALPDKNGNPAFAELYTHRIQAVANHQGSIFKERVRLSSNPFMIAIPQEVATKDVNRREEDQGLPSTDEAQASVNEVIKRTAARQETRASTNQKALEDARSEKERKDDEQAAAIEQKERDDEAKETAKARARGEKAAKKFKVKDLIEGKKS